MSAEDIEEEPDLIRRLYFSKVTTKEIHKALADIGKKLGPAGKQKVSGRAYSFGVGYICRRYRDGGGGRGAKGGGRQKVSNRNHYR